jgi:hypothetical protein
MTPPIARRFLAPPATTWSAYNIASKAVFTAITARQSLSESARWHAQFNDELMNCSDVGSSEVRARGGAGAGEGLEGVLLLINKKNAFKIIILHRPR